MAATEPDEFSALVTHLAQISLSDESIDAFLGHVADLTVSPDPLLRCLQRLRDPRWHGLHLDGQP